jgi:hypothetical protein
MNDSKIIHFDDETGEEFEIIREPSAGGWLQGHVDVSYSDLVSAFGQPSYLSDDGGKVQCEWDLRINGVLVTIYDWKEDRSHLRVRDWHVGGTSPEAARLVQGVLRASKRSKR